MSIPLTKFAAAVPHYRNPGPLPTKERLASGIAGASLFLSGWKRGGFGGLLLAAAGADLLYRGICGQGHIYEMLPSPRRKLLGVPKESENGGAQAAAA